MNTFFFPAIFHKAEEGGYWVSFPDLPECLTQGDSFQHACEMANDALALALTSRIKEKEKIPVPSAPESISTEPNSFIVALKTDLYSYKKHTNSIVIKAKTRLKKTP